MPLLRISYYLRIAALSRNCFPLHSRAWIGASNSSDKHKARKEQPVVSFVVP
jgi:hypothetical protein